MMVDIRANYNKYGEITSWSKTIKYADGSQETVTQPYPFDYEPWNFWDYCKHYTKLLFKYQLFLATLVILYFLYIIFSNWEDLVFDWGALVDLANIFIRAMCFLNIATLVISFTLLVLATDNK